MSRRITSDYGRERSAGIWALRARDPKRVAPPAGPPGDRRNGAATGDHVIEEWGHAEEALAFAASIVESSDDAIVDMTLGAERLYGFTAREVLGRWPIGITLSEDEQPTILTRVGCCAGRKLGNGNVAIEHGRRRDWHRPKLRRACPYPCGTLRAACTIAVRGDASEAAAR